MSEPKKKCATCNNHCLLSEFIKDALKPDGHSSYCRTCYKKRSLDRDERYKEKNKDCPQIKPDAKRECYECGKKKNITEFPKDAIKSSGYGYTCKECKNNASYFDPNIDPNTTKKKCKGPCGSDKFLVEYSMSKTGVFGYANKCKKCRSDERKKINFPKPTEGTQKCTGKCEKVLSISEFHGDKGSGSGLRSECKECYKVTQKISQSSLTGFIMKILKDAKNNAKKKSNDKRTITFNITKEDIAELYESQGGLCALTNTPMTYSVMKERSEEDSHILNPTNISIDRINPSKGYEKDNIQLVCAIVNRMKYDLTVSELLDWCKKVIKNTTDNKIKEIEKDFNVKTGFGPYESKLSEADTKKFIHYKYSTIIHNAKKSNREVTITEGDIFDLYTKQNGLCNLTGHLMTISKDSNDISCDRIDPSKGYVK